MRLPLHVNNVGTEPWRAWVSRQELPVAVDLFSGAGGLSLGLEAAGYRVVLAADVDPWALETHRHNFPGAAIQSDLGVPAQRDELVRLLEGLDVNLIAGGPPCQPYSRAGRSKIRSLVDSGVRDGEDQRRHLWLAFLDIVERVLPQAVLMENVPDMALSDDANVLRVMMGRLEAKGYETDFRLVDASDHGVPQHRQRLILIGLRDASLFHWPVAREKVTLRDAIGDLPSLDAAGGETGTRSMPYATEPFSDFQRRARKECTGEFADTLFDHVTRHVRADDLEAFVQMDCRTRYSDLPKELRRYRDDIFDDKYKRLGWSEPSRSITAHIAKDGYWYIHPGDQRTLSVREAARIQTFPDHFRFAGSRSHQYKQIGNAVPPALAEAIGTSLLQASRGASLGERPSVEGPSGGRKRLRSALDAWAARDAEASPWAYPTAEPWPVLVGIVLGSGRGGRPGPAEVLEQVPTLAKATPARLRVLTASARPSRRPALERLLRAAAELRRSDTDDPASWRGVALGPGSRAWLETLVLDHTALTPSTATLRVVARFTGTNIDRERRRSDGRLELAKLIGTGFISAHRNAALHRLGVAVCRSGAAVCRSCPLAQDCRSSNL